MQPFHFGDWLRDSIADLGLTQVQFSQKAEIPLPTVKGWIGTQCPPMRRHNAVRLARALGLQRQDIEAKLAEARQAQSDQNPPSALVA